MSLALSIVIPTKDRPGFLPVSVASALAALPATGGEVIVVDDRSQQPAAEILAGIADDRLRVVVNRRAAGPAGARNFGVDHTSGDVILFLDDDDLVMPGYPQWIIEQQARKNAADYGFCETVPFTSDPPPPQMFKPPAQPVPVLTQTFRRQMAAFSWGFWVRRDVFVSLDGIDEDLRVNEDTEFSLRLLTVKASGLWSEQPGVLIRRHAVKGNLGSITQRTSAAERAGYFDAILTRHAVWLQQRVDARRHLLRRRLKLLAKSRDDAAAKATLQTPAASGLRAGLWAYYQINRFMYGLRR
ncbi:glycosyltransferase [Tabrizicola sp. WMC-M-20]|nr:glycosyltransferase [Tabrizicola sp. WMC-M-20]